MSDAFDPYRKWLGIPPAEQPPHCYRLLGIGLFEDDADTIAIAADRQMAHVRTFQTGPHSALSQKLLNELAAARLTLLDTKKKASYDEQLRTKLAPALEKGRAGEGGKDRRADEAEQGGSAPKPQAAARPKAPIPLAAGHGRGAESAPAVEFGQDPASVVSPATRLRRQRSRGQPAVWLGLAVAAVALAGVVYVVYNETKTGSEPRTVAELKDPARSDEQPSHGAERATETVPVTDVTPPVRPQPEDVQIPKLTHVGPDTSVSDQPNLPSVQPGVGDQSDQGPPEKTRSDEEGAAGAASKPDTPPGDQGVSQPPEAQPSPTEKSQPQRPRSLADLATIADRPQLARTHRESPPEGKALTAAAGRFAQQYSKDLKEISTAKTTEARQKVALKIWNEARDGSQTADLRYVMLENVGKEALALGSIGMAYRVTAEVARQFDVDPLAMRIKVLDTAGKGAQSPDACAIGALQALSVADRAVAEGRLDLASKAAGQAAVLARKTKDKELIAQIDRRKGGLRERSQNASNYKKALADLKKTPDDREANLIAGRYEVLVLGDWVEGLKKLATSAEGPLAEIAHLEAMARADLSQWAPLAVAWWQMSQVEADEFFKPLCQLQAKYCYLRARKMGRAGEVPPETADQLKSLPGYPMCRLVPGVAARYYDGADFQRQRLERTEPAVDFYYGQGSPDPSIQTNRFSARWTGFIKAPVSTRYLIATFTNDAVRLWVDGKQVLNRWGQVAGWQQVELDLTDEPHSFVLEYNEIFDVGIAMFGWTLAAFPDDQHQQWSPIDALYYDPESPFDLPDQL